MEGGDGARRGKGKKTGDFKESIKVWVLVGLEYTI